LRESTDHFKAKERIRNLARAKGLIVINEFILWAWSPYHNKTLPYTCDVFILSIDKTVPTIVEVDGHVGHSNKYQIGRDERRTEDIQSFWGDHIRVRRFTLEELEIATDQEIEKEIGI
jgi:hypothetical protein